MDEKELGKRIQQERKRRNLTQGDVEGRIGLPQKAMTRIESGERGPSSLELAKLAELFHMPIGDFLNGGRIDEDPLVILYRAAPGLKQNHAIQKEVDRYVYLCKEGISLGKLLGQPFRQRLQFSSFEQPCSSSEAARQGEQVAKEERRRLGISSLPIGDVAELLASQGIWCGATRLPEEMSGLFLCSPSVGRVILINAIHPSVRQRFSYAHEYAHALFDANYQVLISEAENSCELIEARANAFAAAFLMPEEGIAEVMYSLNKGAPSRTFFSICDSSSQEVIEAEQRQLAKNQKLYPEDVASIAHRFGVSYQAAVYRLHNLRYLSPKAREELLKEECKGRQYLRMLGLEELERNGKNFSLQPELRTDISRLVIDAYRQEKISRGRVIELSKLLDLPPQDLIEHANIENE